MRQSIAIFTLLSLLLILPACQSGATPQRAAGGKGEVAAVVNGTTITVGDVDRVTAQQAKGQEQQLSQLEAAAARLQALDGLVTQEVLYQRAKKENLTPTEEEVKQEIQRNKQESGMTEEAFKKQLEETNQTEAQLQEDVRKQIAIRKLQDKVTAQLKVQDREIEDFFKQNPQQFVARPGVAISDIIADPADNGAKFDAKGDVAAEQKSKDIYARLRNGADFATIARQQSEHESAYRSGDLGFIAQDQFSALTQQGLPATLGPRLMQMREGDITEPLRDGAGRWHIFKLTQKRTESKELTLNDPDVRKQISDYILNQRKQLLNAALLNQARDEAKVENFLAQRMLENPNTFGVLRPLGATASASPGAAASTSPSPAATAK